MIKRLLRKGLRAAGYDIVRVGRGGSIDGLRRELDDLRSFRAAALVELEQLKQRAEVDRDNEGVQREYLRTLLALAECDGDRPLPEPRAPFSDDAEAGYPSCAWIEGGVHFAPGRLRVCPNANTGGGSPGIVPFTEGRLPVEDIVERRRIIRRANRSGLFPPCAQCAFRTTRTWPRRRYAFDVVCISHATACNLACRYCHSMPEERHLQRPSSVPRLYPTFASLIEEGLLAPNARVQWGGGEPTILREFDELFGLLDRHGANSEVYTSGVRVPPILFEAVADGRAGVMISLDAGTPETYRRIKGRDVFDRVIANVSRYAEANPQRTLLKMILFEDNLGEVTNFLDVASRAGVRIVCFDTPMYRDHVPDRLVDAAARFAIEAEARGLEWRAAEVGMIYNVADSLHSRVAAMRSGLLDARASDVASCH